MLLVIQSKSARARTRVESPSSSTRASTKGSSTASKLRRGWCQALSQSGGSDARLCHNLTDAEFQIFNLKSSISKECQALSQPGNRILSGAVAVRITFPSESNGARLCHGPGIPSRRNRMVPGSVTERETLPPDWTAELRGVPQYRVSSLTMASMVSFGSDFRAGWLLVTMQKASQRPPRVWT